MNNREEKEWQTLASLSQQGDSAAYRELLEGASSVLKQFLVSRISDRERVEDILQEVLLSMHLALPSYSPKNSFSAWMYTIARRRMIDFLRKKKRRSQEAVTEDTFFDSEASENEMSSFREFSRVLEKLPERKRKAVKMVHIDGKSLSEAASELEITENNLRVTLHRAQKEIRKKISE